MEQEVQKAIKILKEGGIVIFPTDTAFGIGCRIDDPKSVERLFKIRKRPADKATPVLVDSLKMAQEYLQPIPQKVIENLVKPYWPGALTIVLPCKTNKVLKLIRGGGNDLGVRMPNHKITLFLIKHVGVPILGPSANFHGEKTPYSLEDLDENLIKRVDLVIPGKCMLKKSSTVIDCSRKPWKILRQGAAEIQNLILLIDASSNQEIIVGIKIDGKEYRKNKKIDHNRSQVVLEMIDSILKKHKLELKDLDRINVNTGHGSFTGIRVGISIANALSYLLKIPVNSKKVGEISEPIYQQ